MCAHHAARGVVLCRKPHPSGARADFHKPHQASGKHCLSQVWRRKPSTPLPSADGHDKQFLCERRRPFGSRLEKSPALSHNKKKIFTVMYKAGGKKACELQEMRFNEVTFTQTVSVLIFQQPPNTSSLASCLIPARWCLPKPDWLITSFFFFERGRRSRMLER